MNLEPTPSELAAREAALRAQILGIPPREETSRIYDQYRGLKGPAPAPAPTLTPVIPADAPEPEWASHYMADPAPTGLYAVSIPERRLSSSIGDFTLTEDEVQVITTVLLFALKRNFEETLVDYARRYNVPLSALNIVVEEPAPAAPTLTQVMTAPPAVAVPTPSGLAPTEAEIYEIDPPSPDPKPVRQPRRKAGSK